MAESTPKSDVAMEVALSRLREMFLVGHLVPGEQIRQQEVADRLGVSRVPLREALNVLAKQGPLVHRPNQGYFVAKRLPIEQAQIRRMLELLENELMATIEFPDTDKMQRIQDLQDRMRVVATSDDWTPMLKLNKEFHFEIFGLSPYKLILEQVERLWGIADPYVFVKLSTPEARTRTLAEHDGLIAALRAENRSACIKVLDQHRSGRSEGISYELPAAVVELGSPQ